MSCILLRIGVEKREFLLYQSAIIQFLVGHGASFLSLSCYLGSSAAATVRESAPLHGRESIGAGSPPTSSRLFT